MRVALTGASGFIGQSLVRAMRARQWEVRALLREPGSERGRWLAAQGCALAKADVTRRQGLVDALRGMDVVVHAAALCLQGADAAGRRRMQDVNVRGTEQVLAAAHEAGVARTLCLSSAWALGPSGYPPEPAETADEQQQHEGGYLTPCEASRHGAHRVALRWREKGLPLVIAMPAVVVGANDPSTVGHLLRLYLLYALPPMACAADAVHSFVEVEALAEGLCLAAERAPLGQDYVFAGEPTSLRDLFEHFGEYAGASLPRLWLPRGVVRPFAALAGPLLRVAKLPPFLSRDLLEASKAHLCYSAAKAERELGWQHPTAGEMWEAIVRRERELMALRDGFMGRLRHQATT